MIRRLARVATMGFATKGRTRALVPPDRLIGWLFAASIAAGAVVAEAAQYSTPDATPAPAASAPPASLPAASAPAGAPASAAAPAASEPPASASDPSSAPAARLDLDALAEQLRETKAIGFFTELSLKNQMDDLLAQFREYYEGGTNTTMPQLRRSYDLLLMKVLSLDGNRYRVYTRRSSVVENAFAARIASAFARGIDSTSESAPFSSRPCVDLRASGAGAARTYNGGSGTPS